MAGERRISQPIQSKSENGDKMRFGAEPGQTRDQFAREIHKTNVL